MTLFKKAACGLTLLAATPEPGIAGGFKFSGSISGEGRVFLNSPAGGNQFETWQPSLVFEPDLSYETEDGSHQFRLTPFFRLDGQDDERTHFDLREANWRWTGESWEFLAGIDKVFWGVTESRHLVDVINQIDFVEDIDEEDKLGQPTVSLATIQDWGTLRLFALPGFRERTFPGRDGRLRALLVTDTDNAVYESSAEEWHTDFALRYTHVLGGFDIGVHYFWGTGREPRLLPDGRGETLIPHYDIIHQAGLDLQYTYDAWLFKLEALGREGQGAPFLASVAGFEYTLYQIFESSADLGILFEHLYDGRDGEAPPTAFDNDLFFGTRLAFNDTQDTSALLGAIIDPSEGSATIFVEAERRLGDNWKIGIEGRIFAGAQSDPILAAFQDDSFLTLRLSRFF